MTDEAALRLMAERGVAWTPTLSPLVAFLRGELPPERRWRVEEVEARLREILPAAQRLGVTVLAGTDATGSVADEVALLAGFGLEPRDALAAASTSAHRFLGPPTPARRSSRRPRHLRARPTTRSRRAARAGRRRVTRPAHRLSRRRASLA